MTHMKKEHSNMVPQCRNFIQGNCELSNDFCWFVHEVNETNSDEKKDAKNDFDNPVFREAQEKTLPDLMSVMTMIKKLSLQVENIVKMTQSRT